MHYFFNWKCWQIASFLIEHVHDVLQRTVTACNFQRQFGFLCSSFIVQKGLSLVFCLPCFLCPRLADHGDIGPTSVTECEQSVKQVRGGSLWCCLLALMSFNEMLSQERTGQNTPCHLRLTWTAAPFGKDLPALWIAEQKERIKGTITENWCLLDSCRTLTQWRVKKWSVFVGKRFLILVIPNFLHSSLKSIE